MLKHNLQFLVKILHLFSPFLKRNLNQFLELKFYLLSLLFQGIFKTFHLTTYFDFYQFLLSIYFSCCIFTNRLLIFSIRCEFFLILHNRFLYILYSIYQGFLLLYQKLSINQILTVKYQHFNKEYNISIFSNLYNILIPKHQTSR